MQNPFAQNLDWILGLPKAKKKRKINQEKAPRAPQGFVIGQEEPEKPFIPPEKKAIFDDITEYLATRDRPWLED